MKYSYSELRGKIKVGDKVRAIEGLLNPCNRLRNNGSNQKEITKVTNDMFYIDNCNHYFVDGCFLDLIQSPRSNVIEKGNVFLGDIIYDVKYPKKHKVLAVVEELVATRSSSEVSANIHWSTMEHLSKNGFVLYIDCPSNGSSKPREITMKEVCEKFGEPVVIKKE